MGASLGLGSLYFNNPGEFWKTIDVVDHHFQPLGTNMLWPDFQVIFFHLDEVLLTYFSKCEGSIDTTQKDQLKDGNI